MFQKIKSIALSAVMVLATFGVMRTVVYFKNQKIEKLTDEKTELIKTVAARDTTIIQKTNLITSGQNLILEMKQSAIAAQSSFDSRLRQLQSTISLQRSLSATKDTLIKNLESGIQVDLITLTYKDPVFRKPFLADSTYTPRYRFGPPK